MKKKISIILIVSLLMTIFCTGFAYAESVSIELNQHNDFRVLSTHVDGNIQTMLVEENNVETEITVVEFENEVITTMTDEFGNVEQLIIDKVNKTLYSTITGKTIDVSDTLDSVNNSDEGVSLAADYDDKLKFSYYDIYNALTEAATLAGIAALLLGFLTAAVTWPVLTNVTTMLNCFSYGLQMIANSLESKSKEHGAVLYYKILEYTKHQAGQVFYTYKYQVVDVGTY